MTVKDLEVLYDDGSWATKKLLHEKHVRLDEGSMVNLKVEAERVAV
jgi:hypothetical protein